MCIGPKVYTIYYLALYKKVFQLAGYKINFKQINTNKYNITTMLSTKVVKTEYMRENRVGQVVREGFSERLTFRLILKDN